MQDYFAAVEYVKQHAIDWGVNTERVYFFGESAGANIVALAGTGYDEPLFRESLVQQETSIKPRATISLFPPVDFSKIDDMLKAQGCNSSEANHNTAQGFESLYLGAALPQVPEKVLQSNPITYVNAKTPAFFIQNGSKDCAIGAGQSGLLADALKRAGAPTQYELLKDVGHGGPTFESKENIAHILDFLKSH